MNLQETVFSIFPGCTLMDTASDDGVVEVSGIGISMVPQNCEVLVRGVFHYAINERVRLSYLVKADELLLLVRILHGASNQTSARVMLKSSGADQARRLH